MLLVLTTLFISISDALPRTSYVKAIDIWLITNLMIPFFEIILQSLMNILYNDYEKHDAKIIRIAPINQSNREIDNQNLNINHANVVKRKNLLNIMRLLTKTVIPGFYVLFCIAFFLYGMIASNA